MEGKNQKEKRPKYPSLSYQKLRLKKEIKKKRNILHQKREHVLFHHKED